MQMRREDRRDGERMINKYSSILLRKLEERRLDRDLGLVIMPGLCE